MTGSHRWLPALIAIFATVAGADDATESWVRGREAFAAGHYAPALTHFERARDAGQNGAAVYYNIAVCQYKLGRYTAARQGFAELDERFPRMRPLAQYNLGLTALRLSEPREAERHFRASYVLGAGQPKLRALASAQLHRLVGETVPTSRWLRTLSARAGHDDNVILQNETGVAPDIAADSPFVEAYGTLRGPYPGWNGIRLDGGFFVLRYPDVDTFNQAALNVGILYEWERSEWRVDVGTHASTTTLGGDGFDRTVRLSARVTRRLGTASRIAARYRYDDVSAIDSIFDGIEGSRQHLDLRYRWYDNYHHVDIGITRETNDRTDPGVSPGKTRLQLGYRYEPAVGWGYGIGTEYRRSEYDDADPSRDEDLLQFDVTVTRHTESGWQFFAELLRADNDSNDPAFSYQRSRLSVGVYRFF